MAADVAAHEPVPDVVPASGVVEHSTSLPHEASEDVPAGATQIAQRASSDAAAHVPAVELTSHGPGADVLPSGLAPEHRASGPQIAKLGSAGATQIAHTPSGDEHLPVLDAAAQEPLADVTASTPSPEQRGMGPHTATEALSVAGHT